jgi:hypothetical protein
VTAATVRGQVCRRAVVRQENGEGKDMAGIDREQGAEPWRQPGAVRRDCLPHRARLLLRLGTAAFACGVLAWCLVFPLVLAVVLGMNCLQTPSFCLRAVRCPGATA